MTVFKTPTGQVNYVNLETGDFSQSGTHTGGAIVTSPALDGGYSLQLQRTNSVANYEIRQSGTTYYNAATAYYSFQFRYDSQSGEGGICNFQDTSSGYKSALHLSQNKQLTFFDFNGNLIATGTTVLNSGQTYTISAKIGTGSSAAWEIRLDGTVQIRGTGNVGTTNNGSLKLGGNSQYTTNYYYDDIAINSVGYPQSGLVNLVNFETGDFSQTYSHTGGSIVTTPALDGTYSVQLQRSNSVANVEIRQAGATYYNLATAYYSFRFESTSNPDEGGIVNFQDTASGYKAALHLSPTNNIQFYDGSGVLRGTGSTTLTSGQVYTIGAFIGTGGNAAWEVLINGSLEMSGNNNLGNGNNGSIKLGGNSPYTCTYYYDDVAINCVDFNSPTYQGGGNAAVPPASSSKLLLPDLFQPVNVEKKSVRTSSSSPTGIGPELFGPAKLVLQDVSLPSAGPNTRGTARRVPTATLALDAVFEAWDGVMAEDTMSTSLSD